MRRGTLAWKIRRTMTAAGLVLGVLVGGKAVMAVTGSISRQQVEELSFALGRQLVEGIWNLSHPEEGAGGLRAVEEQGQDPDPAYRQYQKLQAFYQEHRYLAWYGDEESGATAQEGESGLGGGSQGGQAVAAGQTWGGGQGVGTGQAYAGGQGTGLGQTWGSGQAGVAGKTWADSGQGAGAGQPLPATITGTTSRPLTGKVYVMEQLADYDFLMKNFYNVHTSTTAGRDLMNAEALLGKDLSIDMEGEGPQILIYHTHSQEAFADSGPGETVVGVGSRLAELLTQRGYEVYHDQSVYDLVGGKLDRSKAYTYACEGIEQILQENPSIQVVLDVHRDGVAENLHLAADVDGKSSAQIMFFNGLSQTPDGPVEYLENPYREDNLAFSLQMQLNAQAYFPGYTRKIYLKGLRYNLHLRPRSALIEVGAQTNTYEEALNAMEPLAELLDMVLQGS